MTALRLTMHQKAFVGCVPPHPGHLKGMSPMLKIYAYTKNECADNEPMKAISQIKQHIHQV